MNTTTDFLFQLDEFYIDLQQDGSKISLLTTDEIKKKPFPGLRPFKTSEFQLFKGRDGQAEELIKRMKRTHFLSVIGSSGTGKSSLVRAGLIPQLFGGYLHDVGSRWNIAICRPGKDPVENLAIALSSVKCHSKEKDKIINEYKIIEPKLRNSIYGILDVDDLIKLDSKEGENKNLLIIIDQFEELFRFNRMDLGLENIENHFVNLLLKASSATDNPVYVIITMRSEFLGDCIKYRGLPEAINEGQYLVPQLSRNQIKEVIEGPIRLADKEIAPGLVQLLINEIEEGKLKEDLDQLPILQHALMRTYDEAMKTGSETEITYDHYKAIGRMEKALPIHIESKFQELKDDTKKKRGSTNTYNPADDYSKQQIIAKIIFQAITDSTAGKKGGRRPTELKNIYAIAQSVNATENEVNQVINHFRDNDTSFIMPPSNTNLYPNLMIDISHESLMRQWETLHGWINEEKKSAGKLMWFSECVAEDREYLRGWDVKDAISWKKAQNPNNAWADRYVSNVQDVLKYIDESNTNNRKRNWLLKGSVLFGIIGIITAMWLISYSRVKSKEAELKVNETKTQADADSKITEAKAQANADLKIKEAQAQAQADLKIKEAQARADADLKIKEAQARADAELKIKEAQAIATLNALPEAAGKVLALTNEKFYQSYNIDSTFKNKAVQELIRLQYIAKDSAAAYQKMLPALNNAAKGFETVKDDPNAGLWTIKEAYKEYPYPGFHELFQQFRDRNLFYNRKINIPYGDYDYRNTSPKFALSKENNLFAYRDYDSIQIVNISRVNTNKHTGISLFDLNERLGVDEFSFLNFLSFSGDNEITALINDSIILKQDIDSNKAVSIRIKDTYGNYIRKFSPNGKKLFLVVNESQRKSATVQTENKKLISSGVKSEILTIVDLENDTPVYSSINIDNAFGSTKTITISPANDGYIIIQDSGYIIYHNARAALPVKKANPVLSYTADGLKIIELVNINNIDRRIRLLDIYGKPLDSTDISLTLLFGQEIEKIDISSDLKILLISINDRYSESETIIYQNANSEPLFFLSSHSKNVHADKKDQLVKRMPKSLYLGFKDESIVTVSKDIVDGYNIKFFGPLDFNNIKVTDSNVEMPPITCEDKIRFGITDIYAVSDTACLAASARNMIGFYRNNYESRYRELAYNIYYRLMELDKENYLIHFRDLSRSNFREYDFDTLKYCIDLRGKLIPAEEFLLSRNNSDKEMRFITSTDYGRLSFYTLFLKNAQYNDVIHFAKRGLELDSIKNDWIFTNLALGYLLTEDFKNAHAIYTRFSDSDYAVDNIPFPFRDGFLEDLEKLEQAGVIGPHKPTIYAEVEKIRDYLNGKIKTLD